jgi:hypothetical protein
VNLHSIRTGQKERCSGPRREVLYENHRHLIGPEMLQRPLGMASRFRASVQLHASVGKVVVLDVDEQQSGLHDLRPPYENEVVSVPGLP